MTHNETRISNELADRLERIAAATDGSSAGAKAVMLEAAQDLRTLPEAEPVSWLSFNDDSEPYLTGNQAEMIKLEAIGPGPHALYAHPLPNPSPSDGEVVQVDMRSELRKEPFGYTISEMDIEAFVNVREWLQKAVEAAGAVREGAGIGMGQATLCIGLDGHRYDIAIRPLSGPSFLQPALQSSKGGQP